MNTYTVSYWEPWWGNTASTTAPPPITITVQAAGFECLKDFVVFVDNASNTVAAIPINLNPLVTLTATA